MVRTAARSRTFHRLFLSYFLALTLLIMITACVNIANTVRSYREDLQAKNAAAADKVGYFMESQLQQLKTVTQRMQKLPWVCKYYTDLPSFDAEFTAQRRSEIIAEFPLYLGTGTAVQELAVLFPERGTSVSPKGWLSLSDYLSVLNLRDEDARQAVLRTLREGPGLTEEVTAGQAYQSGACIVICCPVDSIAVPRAVSCFFINKQWLTELLQKQMPSNMRSFRILERASGREVLSISLRPDDDASGEVRTIPSGYLGWRYECGFDDPAAELPASGVSLQLLLSVGLLALGALLSVLLAVLTYRPLDRVLRQVAPQKESGSSKLQSDYGLIEQSFNRLEQENARMRTDMADYEKIKLDYFHLQIRPHFFLNCLNILYHMAQTRRYSEIQRFVLVVSDYLRYIFANNMEPVLVEDEVEHIRKYLEIQEIRYLTPVGCEIRLDEEARGYLIPPLLLQTFVENAVRSTEAAGRAGARLGVRIRLVSRPEGRFFEMTVEDTGDGFEPGVLEALSQGEGLPDEDGRRRIGIQNSIQRLRLMYGDEAEIRFYNRGTDGGAVVRISIPVRKMERRGGRP